jgi:hypothetical protein
MTSAPNEVSIGTHWRLDARHSKDGRAWEVLVGPEFTDDLWQVIIWPDGEGMESSEAAASMMQTWVIQSTCTLLEPATPDVIAQIEQVYAQVSSDARASYEQRQKEKMTVGEEVNGPAIPSKAYRAEFADGSYRVFVVRGAEQAIADARDEAAKRFSSLDRLWVEVPIP